MGLSTVLSSLGSFASPTKNGVKHTHTNGSKAQKADREQTNGTLASPENDAAAHLDPFYKIVEQPIGSRRPIRVACLGAGYSGLMMSIVFSQKMQGKNAELVVYERNSDIGGTWLENR